MFDYNNKTRQFRAACDPAAAFNDDIYFVLLFGANAEWRQATTLFPKTYQREVALISRRASTNKISFSNYFLSITLILKLAILKNFLLDFQRVQDCLIAS